MHHDRNVVIHKLADIPQKARRNNTHGAKGDAGVVHVFVAFRKRNLARPDYQGVCRLVARDSRNEVEGREQGCSREGDGLLDVGDVGDAELELHGAANVVGCGGDEFVDEDVVVDAVANGPSDDADGEGEGSDGGDQVL